VKGGDTVGYRMVGRCPKCKEALFSEDIRVERPYTDEGAILNSKPSVFRRYMLFCEKRETIKGSAAS